jgi:hypothetical protein
MKTFKPPYLHSQIDGFCIFLAGSIEMGKAVEWQDKVSESLEEYSGNILNPRRAEWDSSWKQSIDNPNFKEQVTWELDGLDRSQIIFFYLDPNTKSPISLLEIGKYIASDKKLIICVPQGFWRRGNIEVLCDRYNIPLYDNLDIAIEMLKNSIETDEFSISQLSFKDFLTKR